LSGIWIKAVPEFDHSLNTLGWQHAGILAGVSFVGILSAAEHLDNFLHWFYCIGLGRT
jgi:hypothetical protein